MKLAIFFNFKTTSNYLHPLQVENCDSNWRLVVDGDDNGKFRLERVILNLFNHNCKQSHVTIVALLLTDLLFHNMHNNEPEIHKS